MRYRKLGDRVTVCDPERYVVEPLELHSPP
jgi:hypothetical protein